MACVFFIIILLSLFAEFENKPMIQSTIARGTQSMRSQSMRPLVRQARVDSNLRPQTARVSSSSSSSSTSTTSQQQIETKPAASTSSRTNTIKNKRKGSKSCTGDCQFRKVNLDEVQRTRNVLDLNLREASAATNSEHLDPSRDGVYARVRSNFIRYGTAAAVGTAIGVGGSIYIGQHFIHDNNTTETPLIHTNRTSQQPSRQPITEDMIDLL